jgi:hypothetical protein
MPELAPVIQMVFCMVVLLFLLAPRTGLSVLVALILAWFARAFYAIFVNDAKENPKRLRRFGFSHRSYFSRLSFSK